MCAILNFLEQSNEGCCICGRQTDKNKFWNDAGEDADKEKREVVGAFACTTLVVVVICVQRAIEKGNGLLFE